MKKKLLIVAHHLTVGGVQKTLISACTALDYEKYDVTLYLRKNRTVLLPFIDNRVNVIINKDPHHYYRKPYAVALQIAAWAAKILGKKNTEFKQKEKLANKIREYEMRYEQKAYFSSEQYDIAVAYVQDYTALFVNKYVNADKKIVFYHTSTDDHHELHSKILPDFDKIAALHAEQKALLGKWYPAIKNRIKIVENYTDKDMLDAQSKEFEIPASNKTVLCSCGRFAAVKGFDLAVNAAKLLKESKTDFLWYFVGDGPERSHVEKLINEYDLSDNIIITGMQNNPYPYMAACDIYVQPSYEEALGLTMLEAHRLNKPVITTATVGGIKLVNNGINGIISEISADSVANAITGLINDNNLYLNIVSNLENTDYSHEFKKYQEQWKALLEE